jgi:RHS repeat-associated protein
VQSIAYDSLSRPTQITNPDNSIEQIFYGLDVASHGGLSTQSCLASTFGQGYPVLTIDEAGKKHQNWTDALGRTIEVDEPNSAGTLALATCYTFDPLDNLIRVDQKGGSTDPTQWRTRTFIYDSLSRLVSATEPESGTTSYSYDNNGNLLNQTSPAPNQTGTATVTISYCFDALNRLTAKGYTYSPNTPSTCTNGTLPSPVATYTYDQGTNGLGRRTGMTDAAGTESWSYDAVGNTISEQRTTNSITENTSYTYNLDGSLATVTYPSGRMITYTTGTTGRALSATDALNSITFASNAHYAPSGDLASIQSSSSIVSTYLFNNRLQPCWIYTTIGSPLQWNSTACTATAAPANILDLKYNFSLGPSDNGNVRGITNNRDNTRSQLFAYDAINRLVSAQTQTTGVTIPNPNCWAETYNYDPWGNLYSLGPNSTTQSGYTGCTQESGLSATATTKNQLSGYSYDAAGNLLNDGAHSYTYNAENQLISANGTNYTYDGDGRRVWKSITKTACYCPPPIGGGGVAPFAAPGGGTCNYPCSPLPFQSIQKIYWYGIGGAPLEERYPSGSRTIVDRVVEYVFFDGNRKALLDSSSYPGLYYYFADQLGTARAVTDPSGNILDDSDFYPFGGQRPIISSSGNTYKFTGYERDSESGLDYASARHYNNTLGRFMSPDPLSGSPGNPQSWNRYSYVYNNPLNSIDPSGMSGCTP